MTQQTKMHHCIFEYILFSETDEGGERHGSKNQIEKIRTEKVTIL